MSWINISTTIAIIVATIVLLQGWSILRRKDNSSAIKLLGVLTILLAVLGFIFEFLYTSTGIVVSPEFFAIMVEQGLPDFLFSVFITGLAFIITFGVYLLLIKMIPGLGITITSILGATAIAILLGVGTITSKRQQIFVDFDAPRVYLYDFGWMLTIFSPIYLYIFMSILYFFILSIPKIISRLKEKGKLKEYPAIISQIDNQIEKHKLMLLLLFILILLTGVVAIINDGLPGPALGVIIVLVAWAGLTEIFAVGFLETVYKYFQSSSLHLSKNRSKKTNDNTNISEPNDNANPSKEDSKSNTLNRLVSNVIIISLVGFILVVFLSDAFNRGKTITQPFRGIGLEPDSTTAEAINERLINHLAQLNKQLQPEAILLSPSGSDINYIQASDADTAIDSIAKDTGSLELGSLKIPLSALVSPVRDISRPIFNVRVVDGSVLSEAGNYILLADASDGGTWRVETEEDRPEVAIPGLVEELAFQILISEPGLNGYGITNNWKAFQAFQDGMQEVQNYENNNDHTALTNAIQAFQEAVQTDHQFSLAYYRLGLALQQYHQPWLAENALQNGLNLNPDSISFKNALAYHLYFYDTYEPNYPAVIDLPKDDYQIKKQQANRLWHQIISLPRGQVPLVELASAYSGLCRSTVDTIWKHRFGSENSLPDEEERKEPSKHLAYFYCYRSQNLLEHIPVNLTTQEKIRQAKAENLNNLGLLIAAESPPDEWKNVPGWNCFSDFSQDGIEMQPMFYSASPLAMRYYKQALAAEPQNTVLQCNAASSAMLLDESGLMLALEKSAQAHYELARQNFDLARKSSVPSTYYKAALKEYQAAINLDPMHHQALNGYAYTYWHFRLHWTDENLKVLGVDPVEKLAEHYARKAVRLAQLQEDENLEIRYTGTLGEVLLANGKFSQAEWILSELVTGKDRKILESYLFDEIRWDLAQASLCLSETDLQGDLRWDRREKEAQEYLNIIRENEKQVDPRLYSQLGADYLTTYRLPFPRCQH